MTSATGYPHISAPVKIGAWDLKNRLAMASLTRNRSVPTSVPNSANQLYYEQRANAGLILSEGTLVAQQGTEWPNAAGIWSEEHVVGWKKVTDRVHQAGGLILAQLWHVGRVAHPDMPEQKASGKPVPAPSAISARGGKFRQLPGEPGYVTPTAVADPATIVAEFLQAAKNAKAAGFDGVELHNANGYLPHQFLDSTSNKRTDQWGGSVENRLRFSKEILRGLVEIWGSERVGIKINPPAGYNDVGMPEAETVETFSNLINFCVDELHLAYIQLVRYFDFFDPEIDGKKRGTKMDVLAHFRPLVKKIGSTTALFLNANIEAEEGEQLLKDGTIDVLVQGRPWIINPDLALRYAKGIAISTNYDPPSFYQSKGDKKPEWDNLPDPNGGYTDWPTAEEEKTK